MNKESTKKAQEPSLARNQGLAGVLLALNCRDGL
jgi:hypothetical protein